MPDLSLDAPRTLYLHSAWAGSHEKAPPTVTQRFAHTPATLRWLARQGFSRDQVLSQSHAATSRTSSSKAGADPFRHLTGLLRSADFAAGNLECPLSTRGRPTRNDACYRAHPSFAGRLREVGFRALSFANNHCFDYGDQAFSDTLSALTKRGLKVVGAGLNEAAARLPARITTPKRVRVAFVGYNHIGPDNTFATQEMSGTVPLNDSVLRADIARARVGADIVIVSVHWGVEGSVWPSDVQRYFAHRIVDCGADVVWGHHSHVSGVVESYRNRPILYSLGNFVFGHTHQHWRGGSVGLIRVVNGRVQQVELVPIGGDCFQPNVLSGSDATRRLESIKESSARVGTEVTIRGQRGVVEFQR